MLAARHDLGLFTLPTLDTDLAIAGLGLGLVIGPLTSATLRVVPAAQHGIASAAVVVARMIGMLVGIAALSAWGLYRFNQHPGQPAQRRRKQPDGAACRAGGPQYSTAYVMQYGEIFSITAIVCVVGALLGLLISGRHEHADEPAPDRRRRRHADRADRRPDAGDAARADAIAGSETVRNPAGSSRRAAPPRLGAQQRSTPRRISGGSWTFAGSSAVRPRNASQMNALRPLGSTGRILSQSCNAVTLVVLC